MLKPVSKEEALKRKGGGGRPTNKDVAKDIEEFMEMGAEAVAITPPENYKDTFGAVYAYRKAIKRMAIDGVKVLKRGDRMFLVKIHPLSYYLDS